MFPTCADLARNDDVSLKLVGQYSDVTSRSDDVMCDVLYVLFSDDSITSDFSDNCVDDGSNGAVCSDVSWS